MTSRDVVFESRRAEFRAGIRRRLALAARDVANQARRNLGGAGAMGASVQAKQVGPLRWLVGSGHPGAYAQEVGAYITPTRAKALHFEGRFAMHARIPAKRWLSRAGKQWGRFVATRLRGA